MEYIYIHVLEYIPPSTKCIRSYNLLYITTKY